MRGGDNEGRPTSELDGVDPRMRGGDAGRKAKPKRNTGRSPHARGRRSSMCRVKPWKRSIPACAGETTISPSRRLQIRVDPRMRGGDVRVASRNWMISGRSPHARGRHFGSPQATVYFRSIPACAGETPRRRGCRSACQVDPRMRGGDPCVAAGTAPVMGRSPHARGRLHRAEHDELLPGSIPACAGETDQR